MRLLTVLAISVLILAAAATVLSLATRQYAIAGSAGSALILCLVATLIVRRTQNKKRVHDHTSS